MTHFLPYKLRNVTRVWNVFASQGKKLSANYANHIRLMHSFIAHNSFFSKLGICLLIATVQLREKK